MAIYDFTGAQISTGDFCEISGAYFKTDNGLYLVTASEGDPIAAGRGLTLHKCGKSGKLRTSGGTVAFWPLSSYCSDPRKNAAARAHNKENAQIKRVNLPTWYARRAFQKRGTGSRRARRALHPQRTERKRHRTSSGKPRLLRRYR